MNKTKASKSDRSSYKWIYPEEYEVKSIETGSLNSQEIKKIVI